MHKQLSTKQLLKIVDDTYPDGKVAEASDGSTDIGDTLAVFLYRELVEDGAGSGTAESQIEELMGRCDMAISEIHAVKLALHTGLHEVQYAKNKK